MSPTPSNATAEGPKQSPLAQDALRVMFDASSSVLFEARTAAEFARIVPRLQVDLTPTEDGLRINATGNDPQVILPPFVSGKRCVIQVMIDSSDDITVQVFYMLRGQREYFEAQSQSYPLKKGRNVVFFKLDEADLIDTVRLDPGTVPGDYVIKSIIAKGIAGLQKP